MNDESDLNSRGGQQSLYFQQGRVQIFSKQFQKIDIFAQHIYGGFGGVNKFFSKKSPF